MKNETMGKDRYCWRLSPVNIQDGLFNVQSGAAKWGMADPRKNNDEVIKRTCTNKTFSIDRKKVTNLSSNISAYQ